MGCHDPLGLILGIEAMLQRENGTDKVNMAYDNSGAVHLAQMGSICGCLTAEEAITYGMRAATQAQKGFTSWSDYGTYYMRGVTSVVSEKEAKTRKIYTDYLYGEDSCLGVSWSTDLSATAKT